MKFDVIKEMEHAIQLHNKPFIEGKNDCCLMCADVVLAMTGKDHMSDFRGKYKTIKEGAALLRRLGHRGLYDCLTNYFGPSLAVSFARRGDLVYEKGGLMGPRIGICVGAQTAFVGQSEGCEGIVYQNTLISDRCFHV